MIIAVDVDDVCCDLQEAWIPKYNKKYSDNITRETITDWDVNAFVKFKCNAVKEYFQDPSLWDDMAQIEGSLKGVETLREMGHDVVFVTASNEYNFGTKYKWLKRNGYLESVEEYIECKRKYLIDADILIDDKYQNIMDFIMTPYIREGILFSQPWNKEHKFIKESIVANSWDDVLQIVESVEKQHI